MHTNLALVLGGGGARAAYQAGFLRGLTRSFPELDFPILTGVSAGAINAAYLANSTDSFPVAVDRLCSLWESMTLHQLLRTDVPALGATMLRWALRLVSGGTQLSPPTHGMVDTAPLRLFLTRAFGTNDGALGGIAEKIRSGRLKAAAITTTNYATGQSITWVQGNGLAMWQRPGRRSISTNLMVEHVLASCALPLFFPAIQLGDEWHGDGGVRLTAPLSPALHLGAERIIAVSTRYQRSQAEADRPMHQGYPPPATVIGLLLDAIFLDALEHDAMNMQRLNRLVAKDPQGAHLGLHPVGLLLLRPSQDLGMLANEFEVELPRTFRFATRGLGTRETKRADLLATLLFQPSYLRRVLAIGEQDARRLREEVAAFLYGEDGSTPPIKIR